MYATSTSARPLVECSRQAAYGCAHIASERPSRTSSWGSFEGMAIYSAKVGPAGRSNIQGTYDRGLATKSPVAATFITPGGYSPNCDRLEREAAFLEADGRRAAVHPHHFGRADRLAGREPAGANRRRQRQLDEHPGLEIGGAEQHTRVAEVHDRA